MTTHHAYRRQHGEIQAAIGALTTLLRAQDAASRTFDIRVALNDLSSKVSDHLTLEDRVLYPKLREHQDARVRAAAAELQDELNGLHTVCDHYFKAWSNVTSIAARFPTFRAETRAVLARLEERMKREDETLGPVLEQ
ncbi:hemerythrin domain-containing protein [Azospirillum sp.]|uniref:hemerythrin domain-containing protein n=1 Tax=Azospirillum sp. TaxID=34012 RepID=UPI003D71D938